MDCINQDYVEALAFDLLLDSGKIRVLLGYLPKLTDRSAILNMCTYLTTKVSKDLPNIVLGDYNMSHINWSHHTCAVLSERLFLDCVSKLGLQQLVDKPTRGNSVLDIILVDSDRLVVDVDVEEPFGGSDHDKVVFSIIGRCCSSPTSSLVVAGQKLNYNALHQELCCVNWKNHFYGITDVEVMWQRFHYLLCSAVQLCSSQALSGASGKIVYPHHIRKLLTKKRALWRRLASDANPVSRASYRACCMRLSTELNLLEIAHERKIISEGTLSGLYRHFKRKTASNRGLPPLYVNGKLQTDDLSRATALNDVFCQNCIVDDGVLPLLHAITELRFSEVNFTVNTISLVLSSMKGSKAVGPDGFSAHFYKTFAAELCAPLFYILSCSLNTGVLPSCWKTAIVTPIFKKGNAADPSNYRPISLTCVPCKILERIIRDQLTDYFVRQGIMDAQQFGFRAGRSTTLQLLSCLDDWTSALDVGIPTDVILLDYAKAFDTVSHQKLCWKLSGFGIEGLVFDWIKDFVTGRSQSVSINGTLSASSAVGSGVPQGSVLGPLLFALYITDLQVPSDSAVMPKFADDIKLYRAIVDADDCSLLSDALHSVSDWSADWQLSLAAAKCNVFHVGATNHRLTYAIQGCNLGHLTTVKDLGVYFDSNLKWNGHCCNIVRVARQRAAIVKRCFLSRDRRTLFWAFCVFVRPILEYASPVWSPHLARDIDLVESVQRSFTKYLPGLSGLSYEARLRELGADSLELRRLRCDLTLTFSLLHDLHDFNWGRFFAIRTDGVTRGHSLKLIKPSFSHEYRRFFFALRVVDVWNKLPEDVVSAPSVAVFRRRLAVCRPLLAATVRFP